MLASIALSLFVACCGGGLGVNDGSADGGADAASDGGACPTGALTFTLHASNAANYCVGAPSSCSSEWLTILGPDHAALVIDRPCVSDCSVCQPVACPASCAAPSPMPEGGLTRAWDGAYDVLRTCGSGVSCAAQACAPAGQYVARMCVYRALSSAPFCSPTAAPTCTDVPFAWPPASGTGEVQGLIGAVGDGGADAGACCPAGWLMYACTNPGDAGAGLACHNPSLGCPSSTTCGAGCDGVVTGRCDGG